LPKLDFCWGNFGKYKKPHSGKTTMNETERNQLIKDAFNAGRDAIVKHLGPEPEFGDLIEVVKHLAYEFLTNFKTADVETALDNAAFFKARLVKSIEGTQEVA
jgi:hypothetical protein